MSMVHFHPFSIANCNNYQRVTSHDHHPWAEVQDLALLFQVRCKDVQGAVVFSTETGALHQMGIKWLDEYGGGYDQ